MVDGSAPKSLHQCKGASKNMLLGNLIYICSVGGCVMQGVYNMCVCICGVYIYAHTVGVCV